MWPYEDLDAEDSDHEGKALLSLLRTLTGLTRLDLQGAESSSYKSDLFPSSHRSPSFHLQSLELKRFPAAAFRCISRNSASTLRHLVIQGMDNLHSAFDLSAFHSLQTLEIDLSSDGFTSTRSTGDMRALGRWSPPIPSKLLLMSFKMLDALSLDFPQVPSSVQYLALAIDRIAEDDSDDYDSESDGDPFADPSPPTEPYPFVQRLLALVETHPNLRSLKLECENYLHGGIEVGYPVESRAALRELCEKRGIALTDRLVDKWSRA